MVRSSELKKNDSPVSGPFLPLFGSGLGLGFGLGVGFGLRSCLDPTTYSIISYV